MIAHRALYVRYRRTYYYYYYINSSESARSTVQETTFFCRLFNNILHFLHFCKYVTSVNLTLNRLNSNCKID